MACIAWALGDVYFIKKISLRIGKNQDQDDIKDNDSNNDINSNTNSNQHTKAHSNDQQINK